MFDGYSRTPGPKQPLPQAPGKEVWGRIFPLRTHFSQDSHLWSHRELSPRPCSLMFQHFPNTATLRRPIRALRAQHSSPVKIPRPHIRPTGHRGTVYPPNSQPPACPARRRLASRIYLAQADGSGPSSALLLSSSVIAICAFDT